jgi:hypothetical protein
LPVSNPGAAELHQRRNRRRARLSRAILYFGISAPVRSDNGDEYDKKMGDILTSDPNKIPAGTPSGKT